VAKITTGYTNFRASSLVGFSEYWATKQRQMSL